MVRVTRNRTLKVLALLMILITMRQWHTTTITVTTGNNLPRAGRRLETQITNGKNAVTRNVLRKVHSTSSMDAQMPSASTRRCHFSAIPLDVEVWSKAAIGNYFWEHIFEQSTDVDPTLTMTQSGVWTSSTPSPADLHSTGPSCSNRSVRIRFRTGYGLQHQVVQQHASRKVANVILILNGHEPALAQRAASWLDIIPTIAGIKHVGLIVHGSETCNNDWLLPYLRSAAYNIRFVFITYNTPMIDNVSIFQWFVQ
eukprot:m.1613910 g.1613910  ORF g.1613910 m.1613910 type:complete len:255 (+) comp25369_c0_seq2:397-1161(+)